MTALPAFDRAGTGPDAVLLLHGIGGGAAMWGEQGSGSLAALAAASLTAVAVDLPGYGASAALGPVTLACMVDAVVALIDALAPRRVALVGHSMGGMVAQEAYAAYPQKIHGLVLSGTSPAFGKPDGDWQKAFLAKRLAPLDAGRTMPELAPDLVAGMNGPNPQPLRPNILFILTDDQRWDTTDDTHSPTGGFIMPRTREELAERVVAEQAFLTLADELLDLTARSYREGLAAAMAKLARSLGLSALPLWRFVILPQAIRRMVPPLVNYFTEMLKHSTLLSAIGVGEIAHTAFRLGGQTFRYLEFFTAIGIVFFAIIFPLSLIARRLAGRSAVRLGI